MKKTFTFLALAVFAANVSSQVISQNAVKNLVEDGSVACAGPAGSGYTSDNFYTRAFTLADYGINYDYKITNVAFGVQLANKNFNVTLNLYNLVGTYPAGTKTLLSSVPVPVAAANNNDMVNTGTSLTQVIPAGGKFIVEVAHASDATGMEQFYMGTNSSAESKPSYIRSVACNISNPTTTSAIGFPDARWVMTITGVNNLGVTEIVNSKNLQVFPNPVKDILNIKMANNLKAESVELYDMTGRKVNATSAKSIEGVNVAGFSKGIYILKVKGSDGNMYIQKVLKD